MRIGVAGHQSLANRLKSQGAEHSEDSAWEWVESTFSVFLLSTPAREPWVISSLAGGADQRLARVALDKGAKIEVIIPSSHYASSFVRDADQVGFEELSAQAAAVVRLDYPSPSEKAFLAAGEYVVDHCEILVAVWDGLEAEGVGGTADIVAYGRMKGRDVLHLDPVRLMVCRDPDL